MDLKNKQHKIKQAICRHNRPALTSIPKKVRGFTLIEALVVLGIAAIVITAVVMKAGSANNKAKAQNMISDVATMVSDVKNAYSSSSSGYDGLTTTVAVNLKVVAPDLPVSSGKVKDQFPNGEVTIQEGSSPDFFTITYTNVPSEVCNQVITTLGGATFQSINVNSTPVFDDGNTSGTAIVLTPTLVSTACNTNQNTIIFAAS